MSVINLSVVAPAFNEEESLPSVIKDWVDTLSSSPVIESYEIVICDDGSSDSTPNVLKDLSDQYENFRFVTHQVNQGAAAAIRTVIQEAKKDYTVLMDSDGQFPGENILRMIQVLNATGNSPIIFGHRDTKKDKASARFGTWLTSFLCNLIYQKNYFDYSCIMKMGKTKAFQSLNLTSTGLNSSTEMACRLIEKKLKIVECEIEHRERIGGVSSASGLKIIKHGIKRVGIIFFFLWRRLSCLNDNSTQPR